MLLLLIIWIIGLAPLEWFQQLTVLSGEDKHLAGHRLNQEKGEELIKGSG